MRRKKFFRLLDRYLGIPIIVILAILTGKKRRLPIENIQNLLFIKLAAIGDSILLIPTLRKLKDSIPNLSITFICSDINIAVIEKIPYVDKIINCKVYNFLKNPLSFISFIRELRSLKYEVIIDAGQWERINALITCLAKKDYSIGFKTKSQWKHIIYDAVIEHSIEKHELENFLDLLIPLGLVPVGGRLKPDDVRLEFFLSKSDRGAAENFWNDNNLENKIVICFHPGCGENGKPREWHCDNYIKLGRMLREYKDEIVIVLTGTKLEKELCDRIHFQMKDYSINTAGLFTLEQTAALVEKSKLMVCSNTGILHIATCVGTKTIGLHGPTNPVKWGAYSKHAAVIQSDKFCSPCLYLGHDYGCNKPTCMDHITPDQVYIAARKILESEKIHEAA